MKDTGGRTSGFDYMRVCLAIAVICSHSSSLSYGLAADLAIWRGSPRFLTQMILPMFFALSGFLVVGSLGRCPTLVSYFGLRILRIVPALAVEVTLSAVIFGPILSSLNLISYFTEPEFYSYFFNIGGDIHYHLPGVFADNPVRSVVNGQLWTIPFELECYVALGALSVIGIIRNRRLLLLVVILGQCVWIWTGLRRGDAGGSNGAPGPILVLSFLMGALFFLYRDSIILSQGMFVLALTLCAVLLPLPCGTYYVTIPITYITVYSGLSNPHKLRYLFDGDYSYGLYLYGYSVQQAFASLGPWSHHWYYNTLAGLSLTFLIAYFSWHVIEKPALALRRYLPKVERRIVLLVYGRDLFLDPNLTGYARL